MEDENLLSSPSSTAGIENFSKPFTREKCSYLGQCDGFRDTNVEVKNYGQQYSHIYYTRLKMMKEMVEKKAKEKWGQYY